MAFGAFALEEVGAVGAIAVATKGAARVPTGADKYRDILQMIITRKVCPSDQDLIVAANVTGRALGRRHGVRRDQSAQLSCARQPRQMSPFPSLTDAKVIEAAPILRGREGEDACTKPTPPG